MIKCIHTGDLHLGKEFKHTSLKKSYGNERRREILDVFFDIINRAKKNKIDILLIAGDLFESNYLNIGQVKMINEKFKEISDIKIVIAAGNHDPIDNKSLYTLLDWSENVFIFKKDELSKLVFEDINTVIWGLSWTKKEEKKELQKVNLDNSKINILLVHGDVYNKSSKYLPIDINMLINSNFNYVALGHIHKHEFINEKICYCGSPEPLDFGEIGEHGIIEGSISKEKTLMKFQKMGKREFKIVDIEINEYMNFLDILEKITNIYPKEKRLRDIYRVNITGIKDRDLKLDITELEERLSNKFYYIEIIDNSVPDYDIDKLLKENQNNIIGLFIKEMKKKNIKDPIVKDALYLGLEALLEEKVEF
ncbi:MAG: exonuclease SbcCD subunit D [Firmicutes bacterium]|nr:exonuclease SbcCD subunit D [Bacillota bacterium]